MQKTYKKYFALFVLPTLIAFTLFFIIPFIMGIVLSFCKFTTVTNAHWVGIANYVKAFSNKDFINALLFTVKFTVQCPKIRSSSHLDSLCSVRHCRGETWYTFLKALEKCSWLG